jgi:hypothetical protein
MKAIQLISATAMALAVAACATEPSTGSREIVDTFVVGDNTLEVVGIPLSDGSFDVAISYQTDRASYGASFNLGDADLGASEDLVTLLGAIDPAVLAHVNLTLGARPTPATDVEARWLATVTAIFGYADDSGETEYEACAWGLGQWEYCAGSGMEHCCMFDHGCSWLCSIFY